MVNAITVTVAQWLMLGMNATIMGFRLYLRRRRRRTGAGSGLPRWRLSDWLIFLAFVIILAGTSLLTTGNVTEIQYLKSSKESEMTDVFLTENFPKERERYAKAYYASLLLNLFALWITKAAFLAFYYEIFPTQPRNIRRALNLTTAYVACTFVETLLETLFWCWPISIQWTAASSHACSAKLNPVYNSLTFASHISSTFLIIILPVLLLGKVELVQRRDLALVLTVITLGLLSFATAITVFIELIGMKISKINRQTKHISYIAAAADQNAIFLAACFSAIRVNFGEKVDESASGVSSPLVIEVEKSWKVEVSIVDSWGHRPDLREPRDPFGSETEMMRTEVLVGGGSCSTSVF